MAAGEAVMSAAKHRLNYLIDLAERDSAEDRHLLVDELCALLLDWPEDYPLSMRVHFDRLLEKAAREVGRDLRASLATRFAVVPGAPVDLLNELFFDAPDQVKPAILRRNALANDGALSAPATTGADETALIDAARARGAGDVTGAFAHALGLDHDLATRILSETSGEALAAACKAAHLKRTTFSTLAFLFAPRIVEKEARLAAYDAVPQEGAESLMRFWRTQSAKIQENSQAA